MKDYKELLRWLRFMGKMQTSVSIYNQSADAIENLLKELHETKSELAKYRKAEQDGRLVVLEKGERNGQRN